ncbi:MAG: hypothetical protein RL732_1640, partial [Bacteroidota bacterium]
MMLQKDRFVRAAAPENTVAPKEQLIANQLKNLIQIQLYPMMKAVPRLVNATKSVLQTSSTFRAISPSLSTGISIVVLMVGILFTGTGYAQTTPAAPVKKWVGPNTGGLWTTASNWSGGAIPVAGDSVVIDIATTSTVAITSMPSVNLKALIISTNTSLDGTGGGTTLTLAGNFQVAATKTLTLTTKAILAFNAACVG